MPINPAQPPKFTKAELGAIEYSLELNDANFEASSWKNPRYDGCQTKTKTLNKYDANDITFGKTAATQKYSRNIYFGNAVVGLNDIPEDTRLMRIENFSYVQTNRFFTINEDNTISVQRLETTKGESDSKNGFYRAFYEDFPIGSDCRLIITDDSIKTSLQDRYNVYFNGGTLKKLFSSSLPTFNTTAAFLSSTSRYSLTTYAAKFASIIGFYNENDIRNFYTGSLDVINTSNIVSYFAPQFQDDYLDPFFEYKNSSDYKGNKRMFITFVTSSASGSLIPGNEFEAIRTIDNKSMPAGTRYNTENLAEISTSELVDVSFTKVGAGGNTQQRQYFYINPRMHFNFLYNPSDPNEVPAVYNSSLMYSLCDDAVPSLLVNLPKEEHLPDGIGRKGFVIVPENIHPHIKQNLVRFLAEAGISLGTDKIPELDNTYEKLI